MNSYAFSWAGNIHWRYTHASHRHVEGVKARFYTFVLSTIHLYRILAKCMRIDCHLGTSDEFRFRAFLHLTFKVQCHSRMYLIYYDTLNSWNHFIGGNSEAFFHTFSSICFFSAFTFSCLFFLYMKSIFTSVSLIYIRFILILCYFSALYFFISFIHIVIHCVICSYGNFPWKCYAHVGNNG